MTEKKSRGDDERGTKKNGRRKKCGGKRNEDKEDKDGVKG